MADQRIEVYAGDITKLEVDAIVNAANEKLAPGGGVCGAIHSAAGPGLADDCANIDGCPTGEARITGGHRLPARHVIHAVGPVWQGGARGEDILLADCYRNSLGLARKNRLVSIAFPAISTGIYGYPMERATRIAVETVTAWLAKAPAFQRVIFVVFGELPEQTYREALNRQQEPS